MCWRRRTASPPSIAGPLPSGPHGNRTMQRCGSWPASSIIRRRIADPEGVGSARPDRAPLTLAAAALDGPGRALAARGLARLGARPRDLLREHLHGLPDLLVGVR